MERGVNYPKHEMKDELRADDRTPAVSFILDAYLPTKDERYLAAIQPHLAVLERFDGERFDGVQPHYMLNNTRCGIGTIIGSGRFTLSAIRRRIIGVL